jgi:hypothetical protein
MNYKRLFFDFLRKKDALEAYKRNFKEYRGSTSFNDVFSRNRLYSDYIIGAFSWTRTPEGHWYWRRLQDEWNVIRHKYKQMNRFNS